MAPTVIVSWKTIRGLTETHTLEWRHRIISREALGLWVVGREMWKVFMSVQQRTRLRQDLFDAEVFALPVGPTRITRCNIKAPARDVHGNVTEEHSLQSYDGFILITNRFYGSHFTLQHGTGVFQRLILQILDDKALKKIERACSAAVAVGLLDPQGFINPTNYDPIVFVDIHVSRGGTTQASQDMLLITQNQRAYLRSLI